MATPTFTTQKPPHPGWDITLTRIWQAVSVEIDGCLQQLARRFEALGLEGSSHTRLGLRCMTTVMSVSSGQHRLFELEYSLVNGMQESQLPGAVLVLRLLDADGQPMASGSSGSSGGVSTWSPYLDTAERIIADCGDCLSAASVHEVVSRHFDLLHRRRRDAGRPSVQPAPASAAARYSSPARFVSGPG